MCKITNRWVVAATKASDLSKAAKVKTLAAGEAGISLRATDDELAGGVDVQMPTEERRGSPGEGPRETHVLGKTIGKQHDFGEKNINNLQQEGIKKSTLHLPIYTGKARGVLAGCNDMNLWRVLLGLSRISPTHPWCSDEWQLFLLLYPSILYWLNGSDTWINVELCAYIVHEWWCFWLSLATLWTAKWNYKANSIKYQLLSVSEIVELFRPQFAWSKCILPVSKQLNFTYISHKPMHEIIPVKVRVAAVEW